MTGTGNVIFITRHGFSNPSRNRVNRVEIPIAGSTRPVPNWCIISQKLRNMGVKAAACQHHRRIATAALEGMSRRQSGGECIPVQPQPIFGLAGGKGPGQPVFMIKSQFHEAWYRPIMVKRG